MDATVVLAVALGLGSLLLWSLLVLIEDMAESRREKGVRPAARPAPERRVPERRSPTTRREPVAGDPPLPPRSNDPRFEQLVDQWFGSDGVDPDDPWRRTA